MLLSVDAPTFTFHFTDDVAFRAAWTTVSQIPLVYLLSAKRGPLNYLTALSYERINWLHRWVGRMIFVSATTHMAIMLSSIPVSDIIRSREDGIQVVRYGVGAYILLLWIAVSSVIGVRKRWHRFFYVNHWISTIIFLGLAFNHVPSYARLPIYASITLIVADKTLVGFSYMLKNMTVRPVRTKFRKFRRSTSKSRELHVLAMGHPVKMVVPIISVGSAASAESTTVIRISDLPFKWKPGQHVRMWLPRLGSLEVHPFTPATCSNFLDQRAPESQDAEEHGLLPTDSMEQDNDMILMIKAHDGLTKRLADYHDEWRSLPCPNASQPSSSLVAFLDGPYGNTPAWEEYESILMLSTSTGVSFMLSILNYLEYLSFANDGRLRTRQIRFVWANRHVEPVFEAMVTELLCKNSIALRDSGVLVEADFYITCAESKEQPSNPDMSNIDLFAHLRPSRGRSLIGKPPLRIRNPNDPDDWEDSDDESTHTFQNSPLTSDDEASRSSEDTYVEGRSDEQMPCLADLELAIDEVEPSYWSRFKIPRWTSKATKSVELCQCARLRHQEQNRKGKKSLPFISRQYGVRPDIDAVLSSAVPSTSLAKTMVTVCGTKVGHDARKTVSRINMDYAMKKREAGVHFWAASMT
ncbi:ferric-chelate reductase Frp1 [Paraconiothyrium brasiliense]|uniref:Ferric-chelate reductase Frp1 n=1 Tax=Paraconiothyrium brasiliense TaxID=300254 RepID=A0ABR3QUW1_9PLEO